jgi:filamentous hemagglutinin
MNTDRFNRQLHPDEYAMAKKDAKIVAKQLGISEQEAEGRIVAEILRNSDQQTADASGGKHDYEVRSIIGCQNLNCDGYNCDGYNSDPNYANNDYNSQYIKPNQQAYDFGQQQLGTGLNDAELRQQNLLYERTGKLSLTATACLVSGGIACKAAATGLGTVALFNYASGKPVTTGEAIGGLVGGGIGGIYGANLNAWAGDVTSWIDKGVLGITKAAPTFAGKQIGVPLGNATGLGGSIDPLLDPATNSWWGFKNTVDNLKGVKQ